MDVSKLNVLHSDESIVVAIKPSGVLSTDEPGGMPQLVRNALGNPDADVRTVHRLDRVVSGVMVFALGSTAASELSRQIRDEEFEKEYLAVIHGSPEYDVGKLHDLLWRNKARKMTMVVPSVGKGVQHASLTYRVLKRAHGMSRVQIHLETGRTHQIRVQFASRGMPVVGERKYSTLDDDCSIALWSYRVSFKHPQTGQIMEFKADPPAEHPWLMC